MKGKAKLKRRTLVDCPDCSGAGYRMMMHYDGCETCKTCKGRKRVTPAIRDLCAARDVILKLIKKGG